VSDENMKRLFNSYGGVAGANIVGYATGYDFLYSNGMPIRYIALPFPVAGQPKPVHHKYIFEGKDQVSGKPVMQAIIDALTNPPTEKEKIRGMPPEAAQEPRLLPPDTEDNLQRLFKDKAGRIIIRSFSREGGQDACRHQS
jgi:hypothetical protein